MGSINNVMNRERFSYEHEKPRSSRLTSNMCTEKGKFIGNEYRFGEHYFYTPEYKNEEHYVSTKYKTLREEVTQNKICSIRMKVWHKTKDAAQLILNKMIKECEKENGINQQECFHKFGIRLYARNHQYYNQRYNIKSEQRISVQHIISVKLFFDNTTFPSELRKTYWAKNESNETLKDIKARHANFAHICRHLCEAIYLYGNKLGRQQALYRGVSQVTFAWLEAIFAGPVSTTQDIEIARGFAQSGSVLKLQSSENDNMYIYGGAEFCSLSNFEHEREYLMWTPCLQIIDIPYSMYKPRYIQSYISAMILFQKIISGHLFSHAEKKHLLHDDIQNKLNILIQWQITGNDEELIELIKQTELERINSYQLSKKSKSMMNKPSVSNNSNRSNRPNSSVSRSDSSELTFPNDETRNNIQNTGFAGFGCLDLISTPSTHTLSKSLLHNKTKFIKQLCGTVFESLSKKTNLFWYNSNVKLNVSLQQNIQTLLWTQTKECTILECKTMKWEISVDDLASGPHINDKFLVINDYLRNEIVDVHVLNEIMNCDEIMNCIGEYFDCRYALDFISDWKYDMAYNNESYSIKPVILLVPTSCRANNEWYDLRIQIVNMQQIKGKKSLKWSFDLLCHELDICMHFCQANMMTYEERKYTQIMSNDDIRQLVNDKQNIVWNIVLRFYHSD